MDRVVMRLTWYKNQLTILPGWRGLVGYARNLLMAPLYDSQITDFMFFITFK